jgi:hypothetical protein
MANPVSDFPNHGITYFNGKIYDPSYGLGPYDSIVQWQRQSLDAISYIPPSTSPGQYGYSVNSGSHWPLLVRWIDD